jgi:hypothetical protein
VVCAICVCVCVVCDTNVPGKLCHCDQKMSILVSQRQLSRQLIFL